MSVVLMSHFLTVFFLNVHVYVMTSWSWNFVAFNYLLIFYQVSAASYWNYSSTENLNALVKPGWKQQGEGEKPAMDVWRIVKLHLEVEVSVMT